MGRGGFPGAAPVGTISRLRGTAGWGRLRPNSMNFKVLLRSIFFLIILFVMLYVGMNNTKSIEFSFPLAREQPIHGPAGLIYFAVFAIGVLGGKVLTAGSGGSRRSGKEK